MGGSRRTLRVSSDGAFGSDLNHDADGFFTGSRVPSDSSMDMLILPSCSPSERNCGLALASDADVRCDERLLLMFTVACRGRQNRARGVQRVKEDSCR